MKPPALSLSSRTSSILTLIGTSIRSLLKTSNRYFYHVASATQWTDHLRVVGFIRQIFLLIFLCDRIFLLFIAVRDHVLPFHPSRFPWPFPLFPSRQVLLALLVLTGIDLLTIRH